MLEEYYERQWKWLTENDGRINWQITLQTKNQKKNQKKKKLQLLPTV